MMNRLTAEDWKEANRLHNSSDIQLLAHNLNCDTTEIADRLFPIEKGFTEAERINNMNAIFISMSEYRTAGQRSI